MTTFDYSFRQGLRKFLHLNYRVYEINILDKGLKMYSNGSYWGNKRTKTPQQDLEKFINIHTEKQIIPYTKIVKEYPSIRIYGFRQAIKNLFESGVCDGIDHFDLYDNCMPDEEDFKDEDDMYDYMDKMRSNFKDCPNKHTFSKSAWYPMFLPDLYFVSKELILCIEVEDTNKVSQAKINNIDCWMLDLDAIDGYVPNIYVLGYTRFGNFDWVVSSYTEVPPRKTHDEWLDILRADNKEIK